MNAPDHYTLLGLPRSATGEQVKSAYRRLAMAWHPDMCADPSAPAHFILLCEAYRCLSDAGKREAYDLTLPAAPEVPPDPAREADFAPRRVVIHGNVVVRTARWVPCHKCHTTGHADTGDVCESCNGVGHVTRWSDVPVQYRRYWGRYVAPYYGSIPVGLLTTLAILIVTLVALIAVGPAVAVGLEAVVLVLCLITFVIALLLSRSC